MIYLIQYNRPSGRVLHMTVYLETERQTAENARLEIEIALLHQGVDTEVVLLEAESEAALRQTHRRYFEDPREIASSTGEDIH